ncbi:MAG: aldehyde ferredoxin oxidoreductase family protein [Dehalococcoidales bacterium]|nr:aldehyde ferredoxin oxidoreductase family protein [Dehalococcoidales bacterium]
MAHGFMGKILWVDLTKGTIAEEPLDEKIARDYLGGYGLGAHILFNKQKPGVDPLGPDAIVGITTGVLTGTDALGGSRYVMVGKSPLTGGWGDANSGGNVGPFLKFAGYDAVFFQGISEKPVYLLIDNGKAELKDASSLWGKDTFDTEDIIRSEHGKDVEVACIGPSGEQLSLMSAVMNNKGRAAARSGLAAVMGSKRLKAIALKGNLDIPVADKEKSAAMRKKHLANMGSAKLMKDFGTCGMYNMSVTGDDTPCKNWGGTAVEDFPTYKEIDGEHIVAKQERRWGCWHCPIACGGIMKKSTEECEYQWGEHAHKPEYETQAIFGGNLLNDNVDSIIKANDICNRYGLDTIGAGACIAFAIECYENGIITRQDTGGLDMTWGNHKNMIAMLDKMAKREGFGAILADGTRIAAEKIGKGSEQYAMHVGGQEIPAHDSRGGLNFAIGYVAEPTPGRHTQNGEGPLPKGLVPSYDFGSTVGRGAPHKIGACLSQAYNAAGLCMIVFGDGYGSIDDFIEALATVSGWDYTTDEVLKAGQRVDTIRQAFNAREGITTPWLLPQRMIGNPPKTVGPRAGITINPPDLTNEYYSEMGWDTTTGKPAKETLIGLGMNDVAEVLYR